MKVLLVYPEIPDTFWSFKYALPFIGKRALMPPLGLLTVAAMLPPTWDRRLVDLNVTSLTEMDLAWADYAFISAMVVQRESARHLIHRCKEGGLKVVAGGPLFRWEHQQFGEVDHFILGEAEVTLPSFLVDLESGDPQHVYFSTGFAAMEKSPAPQWDLVNFRYYSSAAIQFSRGCPFDCEFCDITSTLGRKPRVKTSAQVITELDKLHRLGWHDPVFFVDDNFIGPKRACKMLLSELIVWRKGKEGMPFNTQASLNLADDEELMDLMVKAGFDSVFVGIETVDEEGLRECGKRQNLKRDLLHDVQTIQSAGLEVQGGFICGFDHDDHSIFERLKDFIQRSGIVTAMVGLLQALPGTKLHKRLAEEKRLLDVTSGDNVDAVTNLYPVMGPEALLKGYKDVLAFLYEPRNYYARIRVLLRVLNPPKVRTPFEWRYVTAFIRSLVFLGIVGRERVYYWRLLLWTVFNRPTLLSHAVTYMIFGYHFRKIRERVAPT
ncbi:MAG: B12-binding domain-containing radical SAM protein [Patescibacteria group bacterium]